MSVLMYNNANHWQQVRITGRTMIKYMMSRGFIIVPHSMIKEK